MNILSRLKLAWNAFSKSTAVGIFEALGGSRGSSENMNGWQYKASKLLGEEIGAMAMRTYRVLRDGSWEEVKADHELTALLDSPNPDTTRTELLEATSMHLDFFGNAFWYQERFSKRIFTTSPATVFRFWISSMAASMSFSLVS